MQTFEPRPSGSAGGDDTLVASRINPLGLGILISEPIVLLVILINAAAFTIVEVNPDITKLTGHWIEWVDYACILYFVVEMALKLLGLGFAEYWRSNWNKYDMVIVLVSMPVLVAPLFDLPVGFLTVVSLFRLARLLRIARLVRYSATNQIVLHIRGPIYGVLFVAGVGLLADTLELNPEVEEYVHQGRAFLIVMSITWLTATLFNVGCRQYVLSRATQPDSKMDAMAVTFMNLAASVLIWAGGFVIAIEAAGQNAMTVLAGLGIGGLAVAFAAQDSVSNVIGGLLIFLQRPFKVGDLINVNGIEGWVETIGFRSFTIRKYGGELVHVPNQSFVTENFTNIDQRISYLFSVPLVLGQTNTAAQLKRAREVIIASLMAHPMLEPRMAWVHFEKADAFGFHLLVECLIYRWTPEQEATYAIEWSKITHVQMDIMIEILALLENEGIKLAMLPPAYAPAPAALTA